MAKYYTTLNVSTCLCFLAGVHISVCVDPLLYLVKFGYLSPGRSNSGMIQALKEFQQFAGINQTGQLDSVTMQVMSLSRCGDTDFSPPSFAFSATAPSKWLTNHLTYHLVNYTPDLSKSTVDEIVARALELWSNVTSLKFRRMPTGNVDLILRFTTKDHGDGFPFDGPGGVLGHAFSPPSGQTHFDDDEFFTHMSTTGINLLWLITHEIGHALGLQHTNIRGAVMSPFYTAGQIATTLHPDDISKIQALYGKPGQGPATVPPPPLPTTVAVKDCKDSYPPSICQSWARGGHCSTNSGVRKLCNKTCKVC